MADEVKADTATTDAPARHEARDDTAPGQSGYEKPRTGQFAEGAHRHIDDFNQLTLDELAALADERGVKINTDVWRAHMITELRAHQTGARPGQG